MDPHLDEDRELRKAVARGYEVPADSPSIFVRGVQFFLIPMVIVAACVGVYLLATWIVFERKSVQQIVSELRAAGGKARANLAIQLASEIRAAQKSRETIPPDVVRDLSDLFLTIPTREPEGAQTRQFLANCLGLLGDPAGIDALVKVLEEDGNIFTKAACLDALGVLGEVDTVPVVRGYLDHESPVVRRYAVFNLASIAKKPDWESPPRVPEVLPDLRRKLEDSSIDVRWNAAFAMAFFLHDASGRAVLVGMLDRAHLENAIGRDEERENLVRHAMIMACRGLLSLKDRAAVDTLNHVGRNDPDADVRMAALTAAREIAKD